MPIRLRPKYWPRLLAGATSVMSKVAKAKKAACGMPLNQRSQYSDSALVANEVRKLPKKHHTLSSAKMCGLDQWRNTMAMMGAASKPPQKYANTACKMSLGLLFKSAAMVGTKGKMENFALAIANAPNINTHMLRMGLTLASLRKAGVGIHIPVKQMAQVNVARRPCQTAMRENDCVKSVLFLCIQKAASARFSPHLMSRFHC